MRNLRLKIAKPVITEENVLMEIVSYFAYQGVRLYRIVERIPFRDRFGRVRGRTSTAGMPDLVGYVKPGKLHLKKTDAPYPVYIEVKRPGGRYRPSQEFFIDQLKEDGVTAFFAHSLQEAIDEMNKAGVPLPSPLI